MNEQNRSDSLLEMARGAILERVDYEAARVAENIEDPNTDIKAKRKIQITLTFKAGADTTGYLARVMRTEKKCCDLCGRKGWCTVYDKGDDDDKA